MSYILLWIMVVIISFWLFKKASGSMSILKPNLLSISFYYSLLCSSYIGALLIALNIDHHYMINLLSDDKYRIIGFYILSFVMIFMPLSMLMFNTLIGFDANREFDLYLKAPIHDDGPFKNNVLFIYSGLTLISVLSIFYTVLHLRHIPILSLLMGSHNLGQLRIEASREFAGNTIVRNIFGIALTPILSMITFAYAYKTRQIIWKVLFIVTLLGAIFMQVYDLAKAPIFFYALSFLLLLIYMGVIKLTWFRVGVLGLVGCTLLVVMYVFIQGVTGAHQFLSYNTGPVGRLILSQVAGFYLHLDLFTDRLPLLMGKSLPSSILGLYDVDQIRSARLAMEVFFPQRVAEGTAGVLNTLFVAEAYANFGYFGVVLGTFYIAMFMQVIYVIFVRLPKNPLFISLFIYFTVNIPRVLIGGFVDFLYNPLWIAILFILLFPFAVIYLYKWIKKLMFNSDKKVVKN